MPNLSQTFTVQTSIATAWDFLSDLERTFRLFPGAQEVSYVDDEDAWDITVVVKIGFIAPRFKVRMKVTEMEPPTRIVTRASGKDGVSGSSVNMISTMELTETTPSSTEVIFNAQVSLFGSLGNFGWGIVEKKATEIGAEFGRRVQAELDRSA